MSIFLRKVRARTTFSLFEPIIVEPLELCYLQAAAEEMGIDAYIIDDLFPMEAPSGIVPRAVVLTGYHTAENLILEEAAYYKKKFPGAAIIAGGIHVERNRSAFHHPSLDFVVHTQDLLVFQDLLSYIHGRGVGLPSGGVDARQGDGPEVERWKTGETWNLERQTSFMPDRTLFTRHRHRTRYLDKTDVALIKSSVGCPYKCDFCYCKLVNSGIPLRGSYEKVLEEICAVDAAHHWVVDDVFLSSRQDALDYIKAYREREKKEKEKEGVEKSCRRKEDAASPKLIIYSRADFILRNADLLEKLKACGIFEVIIGFEATSEAELEGYNKMTDATDYPKVIDLLKRSGIDLTALFMVQPDYGVRDFRRLSAFIRKNRIETYTISILTPVKGTENYRLMEDQLLTRAPEKFDFLHLVLPSKLKRPVFYLLFYGLHMRLLGSPRILGFLRQGIFGRRAGRPEGQEPAGASLS